MSTHIITFIVPTGYSCYLPSSPLYVYLKDTLIYRKMLGNISSTFLDKKTRRKKQADLDL